MNLKEFLFLVAMTVFFSCGQDANPGGGLGGDGDDSESVSITQEQLDGLNTQCISQAYSIQLPAALNIPANYSSDEYAAEVWAAATISKALITSFGFTAFPLATAKAASTDGLDIFNGEEAYSWGEFPEKYVYVTRSDGYEIFVFASEDDILGRELILVRQNEDCSRFNIYQRAIEDSEYLEAGDVAFQFIYMDVGSQIYQFRDYTDGDGRDYNMKSLTDLGGSLDITDASDDSLVAIDWDKDGNGIWERRVNGIVVETGTWEF